jgi:hypothetical protein
MTTLQSVFAAVLQTPNNSIQASPQNKALLLCMPSTPSLFNSYEQNAGRPERDVTSKHKF